MFGFVRCRTKNSATVKRELKSLFEEFGEPKVIQHDCGKEFEGEVRIFLKKKKIKQIKSRPYHPQSQGKVERMHLILKKKIAFDLLKMKQVGVNWVRQLQKYERKINDGPKECLAWKCPFEIYYGRTRQSHLRKSFKSPQVWEDHVKHNRNLAQKATRHCNDRKNKAWMNKSKTPINEVGQQVLVRYRTRNNNRVPNKAWALLGTVIKAEKRNHKYQVSFVPPYSKCNKKQWLYVSDITGSSLSGGKNSSNPEQRQKKHSNYKSPYYMILTPKDKTYNLISDFRLTVAFNPPGDGNCQFAAILHQLQRLGIYRSAETLRREVITYLGQTSRLGSADNRVLWSNMIIESRSDYLLRMSRDTEFGDQITLQAISDMFNVQIVIVSTLNHGTTLLRPDGSNIITRHLPIITIGHYPEGHGEHYLSLTYNHNAVRRIAEDSSQIHWGYDDTDDEHDDRSDGHDDTDDKHHDTDDGSKTRTIQTQTINTTTRTMNTT
ncbi:unnamed protein product [Mytilus coruscus]|uniref:Integrase catalytic domain-containing protein n=1 Tax=Mytilus coruscus TaxID=42192 RepID=A0A6J8B5H8_MYTCO|nr:unnamed protein product [Mytilus coruscus]